MSYLSFEKLKSSLKNDNFFIVDRKVFDLHEANLSFLDGKCVFFLEDPEREKSFETLEKAISFFLERRINRTNRIVVIGGGATTDLGGFVASIILRGVDWVCVPTTLLGIIDASLGGKTGINTPHGKNLVGSFHRPVDTMVVEDFLETLPEDEKESGKGELLKYAFLDKKVYEAVVNENSLENIMELCRSCKIKIVDKDFKEEGQRMVLNLGHTFGHVLEVMMPAPHGVAVTLGLEMVLKLFKEELLDEYKLLREKLKLNKYSLPNDLNEKEFWRIFLSDKKMTDEGINLILPKQIGEVEVKKFSMEAIKDLAVEKLGNLFA